MSAASTPERIAAHVIRRVLPGYQRSLQVVMDAIRAAEEIQAQRKAMLDELAEAGAVILCDRDSGKPDGVRLPLARKRTRVYGTFRPDDGGQAVRIAISSVPQHVARRIMAEIAARAS